MKSRLMPWVGVLVLLFLVLSSWWAVQLRERQRAQNFVEVDPSLPDAWSGQFIMLNADKAGDINDFLQGKNMAHYPAKHIWQAQDPLYIHRGGKSSPTFSITADVAYVMGRWKQQVVRLQGNATMRRYATADKPSIWIRSHSFTIDPKAQTVRTDDPVEVIEGKNHLSGVGMIYNNRTGQLEILHQSDVKLPDVDKKGVK